MLSFSDDALLPDYVCAGRCLSPRCVCVKWSRGRADCFLCPPKKNTRERDKGNCRKTRRIRVFEPEEPREERKDLKLGQAVMTKNKAEKKKKEKKMSFINPLASS